MLKNMKIKTSLLIGFGVTILVFVLAIIACLVLMNSQTNAFDELIDTDVYAVELIKDIRIQANIAARNVRNILLLPDNPDNPTIQKAAEDASKEMTRLIAELRRVYPLNDNSMDQFVDVAEDWQNVATQIMNAAVTGTESARQQAINAVQTDCIPRLDLLGSTAETVQTALTNAKDATIDSQMKTFQYLTLVIIGVLVVMMIFMTVLITNIIKSITVPTEQVRKAIVAFSEGNFKVKVDYESESEVGQMCAAMRTSQDILASVIDDIGDLLTRMAGGDFSVVSRDRSKYVGDLSIVLTALRGIKQKLSTTMTQIRRTAEEVASGSDQVSSGAQALSQGATEQASSVEELAATIATISNQINQNAANAQQASGSVSQVGEKIALSNDQMKEMTAAMDEISQKSKEISAIVDTIENIAFQTNILALNAAVEAARAGAAGRSFAVVADEVRSLASKSAEASANTSALIEGSVKAVEKGTRIAAETAKELMAVAEGSQEIVNTISQIAEASQQQAEAVAQVTQGVDQISSVIQTNSATAQESAAASEELAGQSTLLKGLVEQFTLSDEQGDSGMAMAGAGANNYQTMADSFTGSYTGSDKY